MQIEMNRDDFDKQIKDVVKTLNEMAEPRKVKSAAYQALRKMATKLHKLLKNKTPYDTGQLYNSFKIERESQTSLRAGLDCVYAMYQEMGRNYEGTVIIENRPAGGETNYFKNTLDEKTEELLKVFEEELEKQLFKKGLL